MKRSLQTIVLVLVLIWFFCGSASGLEITSYYSPRNCERPPRTRTDYIILHTTEGAAKGSLRKVRKNGEAHYFVNTDGHIYRIIRKERVAFHAGRSMWRGRTNIDNSSLGIEVVGYHNKSITTGRTKAPGELPHNLQPINNIPVARAPSHPMIAYGAPNGCLRAPTQGGRGAGTGGQTA